MAAKFPHYKYYYHLIAHATRATFFLRISYHVVLKSGTLEQYYGWVSLFINKIRHYSSRRFFKGRSANFSGVTSHMEHACANNAR